MSSEKAFRLAHPEPIPSAAVDVARLAVEFTYQFWTFDHEDIFPKPPPGRFDLDGALRSARALYPGMLALVHSMRSLAGSRHP